MGQSVMCTPLGAIQGVSKRHQLMVHWYVTVTRLCLPQWDLQHGKGEHDHHIPLDTPELPVHHSEVDLIGCSCQALSECELIIVWGVGWELGKLVLHIRLQHHYLDQRVNLSPLIFSSVLAMCLSLLAHTLSMEVRYHARWHSCSTCPAWLISNRAIACELMNMILPDFFETSPYILLTKCRGQKGLSGACQA